jgi:hypothetical protein
VSDETRKHIYELAPVERGSVVKGFAYDDETRARCFVLYATFAARNCAKTARLYEQEVKALGLPAPDVRTIQLWAADDDWYGQADDFWRHSKGRTPYELQILSSANTMQAQQALHDILTGADERDLNERLITLKAIEVAMKARERLPELARIEPPEQTADTASMSREEQEAHATAAISRKKGKSA